MKPFISKLSVVLGVCTLFVACNSQEETPASDPVAEPEVVETIAVEAPLTAPQPVPIQTQTKNPAKTQATKTLYPGEVVNRVKAWDKKLKFLKTNFTQTAQYDAVPVS